MSGNYQSEIIVQGKKYARGPRLAPELCKIPEKCANCEAVKQGIPCLSFGYECLEVPETYWILKKSRDVPRELVADIPEAERVKCAHCRKSFRASKGVTVGNKTWCPWCADKHAVECVKCGSTVPEDASGKVGYDVWCSDCMAEHAETCGHCGGKADREAMGDVTTGSGVERWCPSCAAAHAKRCAHCNKLVESGMCVQVDGETWCSGCAGAHASQCPTCGRRTASAGPEGDGVCSECAAQAVRRAVHDYHGYNRRDNPVFWPPDGSGACLPEELYLGFELEAGGTDERRRARAAVKLLGMSDGEKRFHMENDSSIPRHGFELISSPHTLQAHKDYGWDRVTAVMLANGMRSHDLNGECGLHVHVSRSFLSRFDGVKIDAFVLNNRKFWERVSRRRATDYGKFEDKVDLSEFGRSDDRRVAVNFLNPKTVEFRMFRGTLKFKTLMATLEIVDGLCRWVKTRSVEQLTDNDGETAAFTAWLAAQGGTYAEAVRYITERGAVDDPDGMSPSAGD